MTDRSKQSEIARCLNELSAFNLSRIGREDHLQNIINDYFCNTDVENDDSSDFSDESEAENSDVSPSKIHTREKLKIIIFNCNMASPLSLCHCVSLIFQETPLTPLERAENSTSRTYY